MRRQALTDVVIVGGGAIGAACAYELSRRGAKVTLLERGPALASGCSAGNAGLICPSHSSPIANPAALREGFRWMLERDSPFSLRPRPSVLPWLGRYVVASRATRSAAGTSAIRELSEASLARHAELAAAGHATGFERRGTLSVYETAAGFAARPAGGEVLSNAEVREVEPALTADVAGAVYHREEAHCDPIAFVLAMGRAAADAGADLRTGVEVRRLRRRDGRLAVETAGETLEPETLVLAAGAWTAQLARGLGIFLPLEGGKGYHVDLELREGDPAIPLFMQEARTIATPLPGRLRLSGTMELAGLNLAINARRADAVRRSCARILDVDGGRPVLETWAGLRPCTPDGLPVIGRVPGLQGVVLATGHAMKGLSLAPVTSDLVGQVLSGEGTSHDLTPFRPERFRRLLPG